MDFRSLSADMLGAVAVVFLLAYTSEGFFRELVPETSLSRLLNVSIPKVSDVNVSNIRNIPIPNIPSPNISNFPLPIIPDIYEIEIPTVDIDDFPIPNPLDIIFVYKCIEDLGCFHTGPPFYHLINRPIPLPPQDREVLFYLYTPSNPTQEYILYSASESVFNSPFDATLPTKILIHGFRTDLDIDDNRLRMKDTFLDESDYNVIIVDWTSHNGFPYAQAASNTRVVGAKVARLIKALMDLKGIDAESIHLIGHSLGAHTAGYAGERVRNIGRITGLDPAGPYFRVPEAEVRLDITDALFVDIIHSDGGEFVLTGLGVNEPIGHQDFYPNGGRWQPGCSHPSEHDNIVGKSINLTQMYLLSGCDHNIGSEYFLESIGSSCQFQSVQCTTYQDYEKGECPPSNSTVTLMGYFSQPIPNTNPPAKFFLRTNEDTPYCIERSIYL